MGGWHRLKQIRGSAANLMQIGPPECGVRLLRCGDYWREVIGGRGRKGGTVPNCSVLAGEYQRGIMK